MSSQLSLGKNSEKVLDILSLINQISKFPGLLIERMYDMSQIRRVQSWSTSMN